MNYFRVQPPIALFILAMLSPIESSAQTSPSFSSEPAPAPEPPPAPSPIDVTVEGDKAPAGSVTIKRRDIREIPGALGDPFRAVEIQAGVIPTTSATPYFFIRGAPPGNVGYFVDGIQLPLLFHIGAGPSVIPPSLVKRIELHLGPYPAHIGRVAGAAIETELTPPAAQWRGEAGLRLGDINASVEGPAGANTTVMAGGRYAAGAALIGALVPSVDLGYADYQARAVHRFSRGGRLTLFAFGAWDYLATSTETGGVPDKDVLLNSDFHRIDVHYDHDLAGGGSLRGGVMLGLDQLREIGVKHARDYKAAGRLRAEKPLGAGKALLRAGLDVAVDSYQIEHQDENCTDDCLPGLPMPAEEQLQVSFRELFPSRTDLAAGAWADALIVLGENSTITPGLRVDFYRSINAMDIAIDPKVVGRFSVTDHLRLVPAVGVASQLPGFAPLPALQIGGIPGGLQRSVQTSIGGELSFGPVQVMSTLFRQVTFNLTDAIGTGRGTTLGPERFLSRSTGDAYGFELSARGALSRRMFFLASYTLSRATRTQGGRTVPSAFDRTHVLHAALLYDLGNGYRGGLRHVFYSGFPAEEAGPGSVLHEHPARVLPFFRFDARLSKHWKVGTRGYVDFSIDLQNATLAQETFDVACENNRCTPRKLGPITIPGLALEAGF